MKKTVSSIVFALITVLGFSQNSQDRQVGDFTGIKAGGNFKITLSQGDANAVKVEASEKDQAKVKTEVKDGNLIISGEGDDDVKIHVTVKNLSMLEATGAASVKTENQINADKLKLEASGAGSIKMDVKANDISGTVSGAGGVKLTGTTQQLTFDVTGAGSLKAFDLVADKVAITTGGASTAKVNATSGISATSSGASSITFKGDPKEKSVEASGASNVTRYDGDDVVISKNDTAQPLKVHIGKNKVTISNDYDQDDEHKKHHDHNDFTYWQGLEFGMNGYMNANQTLDMPSANYNFLELNYSKSLNFDLNLFEKNIHIYKNNVNLVTGLGFEFDHYSFKHSITLDPNSDLINATFDSTISYHKNKLNASYIDVPLLLMFNTNSDHPSKGFHIGGGVIGGYKIRSVTKQEYNLDGYEYDVKKKDDYNLNPFKLSATVRAGFGGFNLFATYALTSLFESNKGPQLYPFTVGISFSGN